VKKTLPTVKRFGVAISLGLMMTALVAAAAVQTAPAKQKSTAAPATNATEIASGKQIYNVQCAVCHYAHSVAKKIGPGLKNIYSRGKFAGGEKVNDESMRKWINNGGKDMPAFQNLLKPNEVRDLMAYLHTI